MVLPGGRGTINSAWAAEWRYLVSIMGLMGIELHPYVPGACVLLFKHHPTPVFNLFAHTAQLDSIQTKNRNKLI